MKRTNKTKKRKEQKEKGLKKIIKKKSGRNL